MPLHAEEKKAKEEFKGAHIRFEKSECDFGDIERKGEDKKCLFRFTNDGSEPLVGESGEILLTLESKKVEKGILRRVVQIRSNSVGGTEILTIKGVAKD